MTNRYPGSTPIMWLKCPRTANGLFADKFLAFKTPLGSQFNHKVPEGNRFTPSMLFMFMKSMKVKLGLLIDLTKAGHFYDKKEVEQTGCKYVKMQFGRRGKTPSLEQTREFINIVTKFQSQNPLEVIGVHCTHGFNRTGFLLVSYMVDQTDCSVEVALTMFSKIRPPGIYKQDYIQELYRRYDDVEYTPAAPARPDWCNEDAEQIGEDDDGGKPSNSALDTSKPKKQRGRREITHKKAVFMPGVRGVEPFNTQPRLREVQKRAQEMCGWDRTGFPGSHPVSIDVSNLRKLHEKPYRVSWKADGVRYLMLIDGEGEVYMLDRDNCVFHVFGLRFLHREDLRRHLINTLLDGEMVIDKVNGQDIPRYLCYDIISFEGQDVSRAAFYPTRLSCLLNEIVIPRHRAMKEGIIKKEQEPLSIRVKQFWELPMARELLGDKFAKTLSHELKGLIFQPSKERYVAGRCYEAMAWKPDNMKSVDFKLKIVTKAISTEGCQDILPTKVGHLYVGQLDRRPFAEIKVTKELEALDNKIIECKFENNQWIYMRERTDKSFPNGFITASDIFKTMKDPVTKETLLDYIENHRFHDDSDIMPPPKRLRGCDGTKCKSVNRFCIAGLAGRHPNVPYRRNRF